MPAEPQPEVPYRPDIDGLRAIAVVAVVLFHAEWSLTPGGFVGVDVFFVISGYLITSLLLRRTGGDAATLKEFYVRRVRRIIPALLLVILFTMLIAHILFLPGDLRPFLSDVVAATLFVSNISAHTDVGYFEKAYEVRPLLHTWSLAIEEQFYLVYPVLLLVLLRVGRWNATCILAILTAVSLIWGDYFASTSPQAAFFATSGRAWELLAGALVAIVPRQFSGSRMARQLGSAVGIICIAATIFLYSEDQRFPGIAALPPVAATALLIVSGPRTFVATWLSSRAAVGVGRMSYSIYLWHWPALILSEYALGEKPSGIALAYILATAMIAAYLSWAFVERPFHKRDGLSGRVVLLSTGAAAALILATAAAGKLANGWPVRFSPSALALADATHDTNPRRSECHRRGQSFQSPSRSCHYGSGPTRVAVWGDSHGVELSAALGEILAARRESLVQLTYTSCPPANIAPATPGCRRFNSAALDYLMRSSEIRTVVLTVKYDDPAVRDDRDVLEGIARSVRALAEAGKTIILVYPIPLQPGVVPRALAVRRHIGFDISDYGTRTADFFRRNANVLAFLDSIDAPRLVRVKPHEFLCDQSRCAASRSETVLYFDDNHLSLSGARLVAAKVMAVRMRAAPPQVRGL